MTGNGGRYFEIDGILEQLTKRWSGRSVEVTEHMDALAAEFLERYGREPTQVELRRAVVRSRRRKTVTAKTDLRHYWRGVAEFHDITPAVVAALRRTGRPPTEARGVPSSPWSCSNRRGSPASRRRSGAATCGWPRSATAPDSSMSARWSSWSSICSAAASSPHR